MLFVKEGITEILISNPIMSEYKTVDFCQLKLPLVLQVLTNEKRNSLMTAMYTLSNKNPSV